MRVTAFEFSDAQDLEIDASTDNSVQGSDQMLQVEGTKTR